MKKPIIILILTSLIITSAGCTAILEGEIRSESRHEAATHERPPEEQTVVSSFGGLREALFDLVIQHETSAFLAIYSYDGDVQADVDSLVDEMLNNYPRAVYAVTEIDVTVTRIVSFFEIEVSVSYKRTKEQADSIIAVSNLRSLRTELLSAMNDYREEAVFLMTMQVTEEEMMELVRQTYYQNPRSIVMLPVTVVETFATGGDEKLIELRFINIEHASVIRQYGTSLEGSVRRNASAAEGENDAEILLSLVENMIGACIYDEAAARTISEHGVQNLAATAYRALVRGSAVGEGFAMALKALCDELGIDCRIVLGYRNGVVHAWNIVSLYGEYYHIDAAMCSAFGVETAFLKTDADFIEDYIWDIENTVRCNGTLTYEDIVPVEEEEEEEEEEEDGDGDNLFIAENDL